MPLPNPIIVDLFDISFKPSRTAIDHIADVIEDHGFDVQDINDYDVKIWYTFSEGTKKGELIVNRMDRTFELSAEQDDERYPIAIFKDFDLVEDFLRLLKG